jgi:hypothetical protein
MSCFDATKKSPDGYWKGKFYNKILQQNKMKSIVTKILPFYILCFTSITTFAQNNTIDSLQKLLQTQKEDTTK